jgi:imidazolonepropionase-like amidohydrolase
MKCNLLFLVLLVIPFKGNCQKMLFQHATLVDGTGNPPLENVDLLINNGKIEQIGKGLNVRGAQRQNLKGKTIMPALISAHVHVGAFDGTVTGAQAYTRANILRQLKKYQDYGVTTILSLGTDKPLIFEGLRDSSQVGLLPGARLFSAGYGFKIPHSGGSFEKDLTYYPDNPDEVQQQMESLAKLKPTAVKMWVDDFGGSGPKLSPPISTSIIQEAHRHNVLAAAHLYYVSDAHTLVDAGLDVIAHSIRDREVDDALLQKMKQKDVIYVPTLTLDQYAFSYGERPQWVDDPFFRASLDHGVFEMITSEKYQENIKNSPSYNRNFKSLKTALINLKRIADAGITVALGTDSGAFPVRTQGYSEHLELELMVQAGLTPLQVITAATKNAARALKIDHELGTLEAGKIADFVILSANPVNDIRNTRKIESVWKGGKMVSQGPLKH